MIYINSCPKNSTLPFLHPHFAFCDPLAADSVAA